MNLLSLGSEPTRAGSRRAGLTGGLVLVLLGLVLLSQQTGVLRVRNWWAIFILVPALASFGTTFALFRWSGRFTQAVRANLFGSCAILTVALLFLADLSWAVYWPLFVVIAGLSSLVGGLPLDGRESGVQRNPLEQGVWLAAGGLAATLLGAAFLLDNLRLLDPAALLGARWWAYAILVTAAGGLVATAQTLLAGRGLVALANLAVTVIVAGTGVIALLGLDWNLLWPLTLIAGGAVLLLGALGFRQSPQG